MLHKLVNDIPKTLVHLGEEVTDEKTKQTSIKPLCEDKLQISDHDILVGSNKHGTFATWNMWNQDSPVSPGFMPSGIKGVGRLYLENEKKEHIQLAAERIISVLKAGADTFALQEAPMKQQYKALFISALEKLAKEANLDLDFQAFEKTYVQTKKPMKDGKDTGYHEFATALLFKKGAFTLGAITSFAEGRGSEYALNSAKSKENLKLINFHGDYGKSSASALQLSVFCSLPNVIVVGDTNIPISDEKAVEQLKNVSGVVVEPATNIEGTAKSKRTLDCFVTGIPTSYIYKAVMENYAKKEAKENVNSFFATPALATPVVSQAAEKVTAPKL